MPQLPQYQQQVSASRGGLGPGPLGDTGAGALLGAGQQLEQDHLGRETRERNRAVTEAMSRLRLATEEDFLAVQSSANPDTFGADVLTAYDKRRGEIAESISDRRFRNAFVEHADQTLRVDLGERALKFQNAQGQAIRLTQATESLDRTLAAVELDPGSWVAAGMEQLKLIDSVGLDPAEREIARTQATNKIRIAATRGVAKANPAEALKKLATNKSGDPAFDNLPAAARQELEVYAKGRLAEVSAEGVIQAYRTDARAGTKANVALAKSDLPPDVRMDAQRLIRQGVGLIHAERREEFGDAVTALEVSITKGTPPTNAEGQAAMLYHHGAYTPEQYTNVLQAIGESRERGAKKAAYALSVEQAIANEQRLDPKDTDIVKAVDAWFVDAMETNQVKAGSDEWINNAAALAKRTNILPPEAMSWARRSLLSGEPALAVPAANAMARFANAAPAAYAYFDDPTIKAQADHIAGQVAAGVPPGKAVENARALADIPKARLDQLAVKYGKEMKSDGNRGALQSRMDGDDAFDRTWVRGAPGATLAMQDEYDAHVRRYFDLTNGDIKRARDLAWKDLRGTYGVSTVNGEPETLKWAPELVFPGIDPAVIRNDIQASAQAAGYPGPIRMVPSRATGETNGILWNLASEDEDGVIDVLLDDKNRPLTYAIPTDTAVYKKAQDDAAAAAVASAREKSRKAREMAESMSELGAFPGY